MKKRHPAENNKIVPISKHLPQEQEGEEKFPNNSYIAKAELTNLFKKNFPKKSKFNLDDQKAIDSEIAFVDRFGFSMGRKKRKALFELIERHDLSDKEIKAIHCIGSFVWDGERLKIGVAGWIFMQGFAQLGIVLIYALIFGFLMIFFEKTTLFQHVLSITMFLGIVGFGAFVSHLYLTPYKIIQQRIQLSCKEMPFMQRLRQRTVCYLD
jgi:hypothetical protein